MTAAHSFGNGPQFSCEQDDIHFAHDTLAAQRASSKRARLFAPHRCRAMSEKRSAMMTPVTMLATTPVTGRKRPVVAPSSVPRGRVANHGVHPRPALDWIRLAQTMHVISVTHAATPSAAIASQIALATVIAPANVSGLALCEVCDAFAVRCQRVGYASSGTASDYEGFGRWSAPQSPAEHIGCW
jgi:hypothetical protein